jgi:hypothetical protein
MFVPDDFCGRKIFDKKYDSEIKRIDIFKKINPEIS